MKTKNQLKALLMSVRDILNISETRFKQIESMEGVQTDSLEEMFYDYEYNQTFCLLANILDLFK